MKVSWSHIVSSKVLEIWRLDVSRHSRTKGMSYEQLFRNPLYQRTMKRASLGWKVGSFDSKYWLGTVRVWQTEGRRG